MASSPSERAVTGRTLWELVEERAEATPDASMAVDEFGTSLTFLEYKISAERVAAGLSRIGVTLGSNVSWELPTWIESLVLVAALSRLGAVQNPIIPIYRAREVGFIVRQTSARLLIVPSVFRGFDYGNMADQLASEVGELEVLVVDKVLPDGDPACLPAAPRSPASGEELPVRWLFYTSGTTADPKGAKHTDASIMAAARAMNEALQLTADDRGGLVFPFTHIGGITWLFSGLMSGCFQVLVEAFDPAKTIPLLADHLVTLAGSGTPFHMAYLAEQRKRPDRPLFSKVRAFPGGGAPKPPQLHYDIKRELGGVGIVSGYGLTECPILSMCSIHDPDEKLAGSEGRPAPGVDVRVVKVDETEAKPQEEGEIRVTAPQLYRGYLDSSLNADAFDALGYFRTGDLGVRDEQGYLVITGRLKDIIIRKGENISAKEIEDLLYTHPKVADVAVIVLADPAVGERCCAVVAPTLDADPISFQEMIDFLLDKELMKQKLPEQLEIVEAVPRNPSGKILKHQLRDQFSGRK